MWTGRRLPGREPSGRSRGSRPGCSTSPAIPRTPTTCTRACGRIDPCCISSRTGTGPGANGQMIPVLAYTNCNSVELFLNGRSLGEKRLEFPAQGTSGGWNSYALPVVNPTTNDLHLIWDVPYEPGVLRAVGKRATARGLSRRGANRRCRQRPSGWSRTATPSPTRRGDVAHVTFEIVDSAGTVVPTAGNLRARRGDRRRSPRARQRRPARPERLSHRTTARIQRPRLGDRAGDETRARARGRECRRGGPPLGEHHGARRARTRRRRSSRRHGESDHAHVRERAWLVRLLPGCRSVQPTPSWLRTRRAPSYLDSAGVVRWQRRQPRSHALRRELRPADRVGLSRRGLCARRSQEDDRRGHGAVRAHGLGRLAADVLGRLGSVRQRRAT